jgi:Uma2 family endonuclease
MIAGTRKRFTLDEYHRLTELGFFDEWNYPRGGGKADRVELIRGDIIEMAAKRTPHSVCNFLFLRELYKLVGDRAIVRGQEPIIIPPNSEPEPDVVIARKKDDNYLSNHPYPQDILLAIEIADSTLKYDREVKLPLYAEAEINNYWIVNLVDNSLEVYSNFYRELNGQFNYRSKQICLPDETVMLPGFSDLLLDLSLVFPS